MDRAEFDSAIQISLESTLRSLGEDSLASFLSLLDGGREVAAETPMARLDDVDKVLDELFGKFSKIIKEVIILQASSRLKLDPPKLGASLLWMVEELRSTLWKAQT